jgi:serine/threonine protein kinase
MINYKTGTIIGSKYKLIRLITCGTFSAIYECENIIKGNRSIIKLDSNEISKKLMKNELNTYMSLQKSKVRIPKIKNTGRDGQIDYIIFELLDKNLKEYTDNISYTELYRQLYFLHQEGIVHRDIKPDNFVFGLDKLIYIIDLGLSKRIDNTITNGFTGNYRYASPICFEKSYRYRIVDDVISLTYMLLDLKYKFLPWDYNEYKNIPRQTIDFTIFYPNDLLCKIIELCMYEFNYKELFSILSSRIDCNHF